MPGKGASRVVLRRHPRFVALLPLNVFHVLAPIGAKLGRRSPSLWHSRGSRCCSVQDFKAPRSPENPRADARAGARARIEGPRKIVQHQSNVGTTGGTLFRLPLLSKDIIQHKQVISG